MTKQDIIEKVNAFLVEEFEVAPEKIVSEANMRKTLDLDSLDYVDLVVVIESTFGFKVSGEDFTSIHSFEDFYNYCDQKVNKKDAA